MVLLSFGDGVGTTSNTYIIHSVFKTVYTVHSGGLNNIIFIVFKDLLVPYLRHKTTRASAITCSHAIDDAPHYIL